MKKESIMRLGMGLIFSFAAGTNTMTAAEYTLNPDQVKTFPKVNLITRQNMTAEQVRIYHSGAGIAYGAAGAILLILAVAHQRRIDSQIKK